MDFNRLDAMVDHFVDASIAPSTRRVCIAGQQRCLFLQEGRVPTLAIAGMEAPSICCLFGRGRATTLVHKGVLDSSETIANSF